MIELANDHWIGIDTENISFDERLVMMKSLTESRFHKKAKLWLVPKSMPACIELRQLSVEWKADLDIGPKLLDWSWEEQERLEAKQGLKKDVPSVHSMDLQELPRVQEKHPHIWNAVSTRPFQTVGIKIAANGKRVLLGDDPGLGKTLQAIGSAIEGELSGLILVVAPKTAAIVTWPNELKMWVPGDRIVSLGDIARITPGKRKSYVSSLLDSASLDRKGRTWVIVGEYWVRGKPILVNGNYSYNKDGSHKVKWNLPELMEREWAGVYVDESHNTLITNTGDKKKWTQTRFGMAALRLKDDGIKMAMSGTPMRGKAQNMWGTLNWLFPDTYTAYWKWVDKHFVTFRDSAFGGTEIGGLKDAEAFYKEMEGFFIRRTKGEVARDMPPKMYGGEPLDERFPEDMHGVWLDLTPVQRKVYDEMERDAIAELENGEVMANGILAEITRLKQFASATALVSETDYSKIVMEAPSNKLDWIVEFLDERGISKRKPADAIINNDPDLPKVIIASQFSSIVDLYERELEAMGILSWKLTGATKPDERKYMQEVFQSPNEPGPRVFLLSTKAGGVSLTLDQADDVIINDETWIPDDQLQVEDRAHRLSRIDHTVGIWYLRSRGTIEETICRINAERRGVTGAIMDESRGVSIMRKTINKEKDRVSA